MSCIFCGSHYHLSEYCQTFNTDESRKKAINESKKLCPKCLSPKHSYKCEKAKNCCICFSTEHLNIFCPKRLKVSQPFLPSIDFDLLPRFMQILNLKEHFSLAFSSQDALKVSGRIGLSIAKYISSQIMREHNFKNSNSVSTEELTLSGVVSLKNQYISTSLICIAQSIKILNSKIATSELLYLLSPKVTELECRKLTISKPIKFGEFLFRLPKIRILQIKETDIAIGSSWPAQMMRNFHGRDFTKLEIDLKHCDFDVEILEKFMKTKSIETVFVSLEITFLHQKLLSFQNHCEKLKTNLSKVFVPWKDLPKNSPKLKIQFNSQFVNYDSEYYTWKNHS